jgi:fructosamine-3-kinase
MLTSVPPAIQGSLKNILNTDLLDFTFTGGGCINQGGRLKTSAGDFFLKWNDAAKFPGMFEAEAKGLKLLRQSKAIYIPEAIVFDTISTWQFIVLEFVEQETKVQPFWKILGEQLAGLHQNTSSVFGLDHDNYIGSLKQVNTPAESWINFFIEQRLEAQLKLAADKNKVNSATVKQFQSLYKKLPDLLPEEKPSLLHGDLWSGNLITTSDGNPCLIDPAVYYGHREAEIAFTMLFGGFSKEFYESYNENFPLFPGFTGRAEVYNLYPLMVHVNLFGGGYLSQVVSILHRFV